MFHPPIYINLAQTPSTNNYARELIQQHLAQPNLVITTAHQTQGKGQFGKTWISEPNKNITLSILVLINETQLLQPFVLLVKVALGVRAYIQSHCQQAVFIKWMNDIYCNDKKAAGILLETVNHASNPNLKWMIIGVGVNVNQEDFGELNTKATSLSQLTQKTYDLKAERENLVNSILKFWEEENANLMVTAYNNHLYQKNHLVRFKKENIAFKAIVKEVTLQGELCVENSMWQKFAFGEVVWEENK